MQTIFVSSLNLKNADIQSADCILFSCADSNKLFLLFDDYSKKQEVLEYYFNTDNTQIVYFGGQTEYRILLNFGAIQSDTGIMPIDLNARYWNTDTTKTNQNYLDALEQLKIIDSEQRTAIELFLVYTYRHVQSGFVEIEENLESDLYVNARRIMYGLKLIYKNTVSQKSFADLIDDDLSQSLMRIEDNKIKLDSQYIKYLKSEINAKTKAILSEIYAIAGKRFNINSPRELNFILSEIGLSTNSLNKNALETNYEQTGLAIFNLIDKYRKLVMYGEQYIKPLEISSKNGFGRFKYKTTSVPCLTQGHFCFVKDRGIIDIACVKKDDLIWTDFGFKKVLWNESHKTNDVTRVELSNGLTITGSSHHPILVNVSASKNGKYYSISQQWCALENLFIGESVICNYDYKSLKSEKNQYMLAGEIICKVMNTYSEYNNKKYGESNYLRFDNIQFSHMMTFDAFKSYCEFVGLKFWCFSYGKNNSHYDIVFYDENSLKDFYSYFSGFLNNKNKNYINNFLNNLSSQNFSYEHHNPKCDGYFNLNYEETTVVSITKIDTEMVVYDIEVEDVHEYNANGIRNHNTGRLASSRTSDSNKYFTKLNIQSVPKYYIDDLNIRKCFLPNENCDWCCIDFKAQEMRLASYLYGLEKIIEIPLNNDIYTEFGKELKLFNGAELSEHTKREASKIICLGMIYGLSNYGIIRQLKELGIDVDETHDFRQSFYEICPELKDGQDRTLRYAHSVNGIYTVSGRFRKIEFTDYDRENLLTRNNRIALNTVIQGACGDIMRIILNKVENKIKPRYKDYGFALLSTIHDEINISLPSNESMANSILKEILSIITKPIDQLQDLQFGCSISIGKSWGDLVSITV